MKCQLCNTTKREIAYSHLLQTHCCLRCYEDRYPAAMRRFKLAVDVQRLEAEWKAA